MWIELTTYGTENRPLRVDADAVEAIAESEWGCTLYLKSGNQVSVKQSCAEVCTLRDGKDSK